MAGKAATVYQIEYSWRRSPEVWKYIASTFIMGLITGIIVTAYLYGSHMKPCPVQPTPAASVPAEK